jgi:hypothetical protein
MAIPKTIEGREYNKFVESPTRGNGFDAVEIVVGNVDEIVSAITGGENVDIADGNISAVRAIYKTVNGVKLADDNTSYSEASVIGVSITGALSGDSVKYKTIGKLNDSSFSFPVNDPIYLGSNGALTNTPPTIGFRTLIGTSNGLGEIQINIQEPIII